MPEKEALNALLKSLRQSRFSENFCVGGSFPIDMSSVAVEGVGTLQFPLYPRDCRPLLDIAAQAPYGRGTETIVDTSVRNTLEIPAEQVHLADHFEMRLNEALSHIAEKLHLDRNRLDCQLYKLLIYSRGGFFLPHRDSEKVPGMIATLVVVLPNPFDGGKLVVRHDQKTRYFPFDVARRKSRSRNTADIKTAEFVAFFSDCEHEVSRITSGVRLCLAFNLIIQPRPRLDRSYTDSTSDVDLRQAIEEWNEIWPDQPIVFALEHLYTNAGLAPGLLKGADATLLEQLEKVAVDLDLSLHFGQVSRHLQQYAEQRETPDRSRKRQNHPIDCRNFEIGEVFDDSIIVDGWRDSQGNPIPFPPMQCEPPQLICAKPVEEWMPSQMDYEGYTGNAGNTLDRWYHKSAIVVWQSSQFFHVITQMGIEYSIKLFQKQVSSLKSSRGREHEAKLDESIRHAQVILQRWPRVLTYWTEHRASNHNMEKFAATLPRLGRPELTQRFFQILARKDRSLDLESGILSAMESHGVDDTMRFLEELLRYEEPPNEYGIVFGAGVSPRDAKWLSRLANDDRFRLLSQMSSLLEIAVQKTWTILEKLENGKSGIRTEAPPSSTWCQLLLATLACADDEILRTILACTAEFPSALDFRQVQVPAAISMLSWESSQKRRLPPVAKSWIDSIRRQLICAAKLRPLPPSDLVRHATINCTCELCQQLTQFLLDPALEKVVLKVPLHDQDHIKYTILKSALDLSIKHVRLGVRHAIEFTKTTDSYHAALLQYQEDVKRLEALGPHSEGCN